MEIKENCEMHMKFNSNVLRLEHHIRQCKQKIKTCCYYMNPVNLLSWLNVSSLNWRGIFSNSYSFILICLLAYGQKKAYIKYKIKKMIYILFSRKRRLQNVTEIMGVFKHKML